MNDAMTSEVYLASQSPRRRELLAQMGVRCTLLLADASEDTEALEAIRPGEQARAYVCRVTRLKADAALMRWKKRDVPQGAILVADTTVALGNAILGKPDTPAHNAHMLKALSGRRHTVYTVVILVCTRRWKKYVALSRSFVLFDTLHEADIERYVASGEGMGKAGGYGVQGLAGAFVKNIHGSYSGIMGLPLYETRRLLIQHATLAI